MGRRASLWSFMWRFLVIRRWFSHRNVAAIKRCHQVCPLCVCWVSRWITTTSPSCTCTHTCTHCRSTHSLLMCVWFCFWFFLLFFSQVLDSDRLVLQKMKKAAKAKYTSGQGTHPKIYTHTHAHPRIVPFTNSISVSEHVSHLEQYINAMEKLSVNCHSNGETEVGSAFCRLADFSKELLSPMKNLVSDGNKTPPADEFLLKNL